MLKVGVVHRSQMAKGIAQMYSLFQKLSLKFGCTVCKVMMKTKMSNGNHGKWLSFEIEIFEKKSEGK